MNRKRKNHGRRKPPEPAAPRRESEPEQSRALHGTTLEQLKAISNLLVGLSGATLAYVGTQAWDLHHGRVVNSIDALSDMLGAFGVAMLFLACGLFPLRKSS